MAGFVDPNKTQAELDAEETARRIADFNAGKGGGMRTDAYGGVRPFGARGPISDYDQQQAEKQRLEGLGLLRDTAMGTAPSRAEILARQQGDEAIRSQQSMAASARGGPGAQAAATRAAMNNASSIGTNVATAAQAGRAAEMAAAQQAYAGMSADRSRLGLDLEMQQRGLNSQERMAAEGNTLTARGQDMGAAAARAGAEADRRARQQEGWLRLASAGMSAGGAAAAGIASSAGSKDPNSDIRNKGAIEPTGTSNAKTRYGYLGEDAPTERPDPDAVVAERLTSGGKGLARASSYSSERAPQEVLWNKWQGDAGRGDERGAAWVGGLANARKQGMRIVEKRDASGSVYPVVVDAKGREMSLAEAGGFDSPRRQQARAEGEAMRTKALAALGDLPGDKPPPPATNADWAKALQVASDASGRTERLNEKRVEVAKDEQEALQEKRRAERYANDADNAREWWRKPAPQGPYMPDEWADAQRTPGRDIKSDTKAKEAIVRAEGAQQGMAAVLANMAKNGGARAAVEGASPFAAGTDKALEASTAWGKQHNPRERVRPGASKAAQRAEDPRPMYQRLPPPPPDETPDEAPTFQGGARLIPQLPLMSTSGPQADFSSDEDGKKKHGGDPVASLLATLAKSASTYEYKDPQDQPTGTPREPDQRFAGVMAQDLEKVPELGPGLVRDTPHGKVVEGNAALSALLAALGRQHQDVEQLKRKVG